MKTSKASSWNFLIKILTCCCCWYYLRIFNYIDLYLLRLFYFSYNNNTTDQKNKEVANSASSELTVHYVGNNKTKRQKFFVRGATSSCLQQTKTDCDSVKSNFDSKSMCNSEICDFWPHCAHRDGTKREAQFAMRSSQSYPSHQRSLDSATTSESRR